MATVWERSQLIPWWILMIVERVIDRPRTTGAQITNLKERKTKLSDPITTQWWQWWQDKTNGKERFFLNLVSTGKVEAALNENICSVERELRSIPAESELNTVPLSRKAWMKDSFQHTSKRSQSDFSRNVSRSYIFKLLKFLGQYHFKTVHTYQ